MEQKVERALSLSLAALLGDDVYNFGELVRIYTFNEHVVFKISMSPST